ncbi:MAG: ABC transporter permease [Myxococcota bacterium]
MSSAVLRLEARGVVRARWFVAALALAVGIVGFFVLVASRESSVLGFTGYGRVMGGVVQASLLFLPLLAVLATAQAVTGARQQGVLEWYLSYPNSRARCFRALFWPRLVAVAGPVVLAVAGLGAAAVIGGKPVSVGLLALFTAMLAGQGFCFASIGMAASALSRTPEQALLRALVAWIGCAVLVDFVVLGVLLRWDLPPAAVFGLAGVNPLQAGRVAILAALDAEMGVLGPVGTWATVTLGGPVTVAYGLVWPVVLGLGALFVARRAFLGRDVL